MALGMIWMRSMEERVFDMMALDARLDPEDVMLRVWMRCLIMWDHDLSTWLDDNQVEKSRTNANNNVNNELGRSLGVHLALACKFAGSGDEAIRDYVLEEVDRMLDIKLRATDAAVKEVVEMAICFSVLSTAVVMTGTRDLRTFGYVRALMNCSGLYCGSMWYEVLGLGAGLLFLGMPTDGDDGDDGGREWSFGGSPEDVAYLMIALYPSSTPEKYWSFCRNLWVLSGSLDAAGEGGDATAGGGARRGGRARDVDASEAEAMTMESVLLRIQSCGRGGGIGSGWSGGGNELETTRDDVQGLLDVFLSSCGSDGQVSDAVVESLVDRMHRLAPPSS